MGSGLSGMSNFIDAATIINLFTSIFTSIQITSSLDLITMIIFTLGIGWVIHSLANKEP